MKEEVNSRKHKEQQQLICRLLRAVETEQFRQHFIIACEKLKSFLLEAAPSLLSNLSFSLFVGEWRFPQQPQVVIVQDGLVPVKGREPKLGHLFFKSALGSHRLR